jgi:hypothetical protein
MKEQIGDAAGKIWMTLKKNGEMTVSQIPKSTNLKQPVAYQGLGWLAKEDKVNYRTQGTKTFVSLTETE